MSASLKEMSEFKRHCTTLPKQVKLHHIDVGVNPGNQTPRGLATVRSILSYCGKPLEPVTGSPVSRVGWGDLTSRLYPLPYTPRRFLATCDVPDVELFPTLYDCPSISFKAGLELSVMTISTHLLSLVVRTGLIANLSAYAIPLARLSELLGAFGSTAGAMHVEIDYSIRAHGKEEGEEVFRRCYYVCANSGRANASLDNQQSTCTGPEIPCTPAVIIAQQLAHAHFIQQPSAHPNGAYPCVSLFSIADVLASVQGMNIWSVEEGARRVQ